MIRVTVVEFLLAGLLGAIAWRVTWAFSRRLVAAWVVALALAVAIGVAGGGIDAWVAAEYDGLPEPAWLGHPLAIATVRPLGVLAGAWIAALVVRRRRRLGLEDRPPYEDFP